MTGGVDESCVQKLTGLEFELNPYRQLGQSCNAAITPGQQRRRSLEYLGNPIIEDHKHVQEESMCREETRGPGIFQDLLFRVDSSKAEYFCEGVTSSGTQPFPRQNRGKKTMA